MPEDGYGWEKLFSERMCQHFHEDFGLQTQVVRYHNVYGPHGTFEGGREKAPAAICRKVAEAQLSGNHEIAVWGDGEQTRSFTYIDDCIHGTRLLMDSDVSEPHQRWLQPASDDQRAGRDRRATPGIEVARKYNLSAPQGVRGRNSDNTMIREHLGWEPAVPLDERSREDLRLDPRPAGFARSGLATRAVRPTTSRSNRSKTSRRTPRVEKRLFARSPRAASALRLS